jgi:outer membrane autotransporter protein
MAPTLWNVWTEALYSHTTDRRYGLNTKGQVATFTVGLDRRLNEDVVLGLSLSLQSSSTDMFSGHLESKSKGFTVGPYLAVRLTPHWAINLSASYGQSDNDLRILFLDGGSLSQFYSGSIELHGQYSVGEFKLRPRVNVSYTHIRSGEQQLSGQILGRPITVTLPESSSNLGLVGAYAEVSRLFTFSNGTRLIPYAELGVQYEFERPNGGEILTANLDTVVPAAWAGSARGGFRMLVARSLLFDASGAYLSLGHPGLDVWEGKFRISYGF